MCKRRLRLLAAWEWGSADIYLGRQPILDRREMLCGFELLFRQDAVNVALVADADLATAQVLEHMSAQWG